MVIPFFCREKRGTAFPRREHLGYKRGSDGDLQVDVEYGEISHPFV